MKYERTASFKRDYRQLTKAEQQQFRSVVLEQFHPALETHANDPGGPWPPALRIKRVRGTASIWELTWSFTDPDGRATWEWATIDSEPAIRWRRIGSHRIFGRP